MNITTLRSSAESIVATVLGAGYAELPYQFDIETNDSRALNAGYSVVWGAGSQFYESADQCPNIEQELIVTITKRVYIRNDDDKIVTETDSVYSSIGTILKRFIMDKLDQDSICHRVALRSMDAPERMGNGRDIISIRLVFSVRYVVT